jgi:hypothetical protein
MVVLTSCRHQERRRAISFHDLEHSNAFVGKVDALDFVTLPDRNSTNLIEACIIGINIHDGEKMCLGDFDSEAQATAQFGHSLKLGESYEFPKKWLEFQTNHPQEKLTH